MKGYKGLITDLVMFICYFAGRLLWSHRQIMAVHGIFRTEELFGLAFEAMIFTVVMHFFRRLRSPRQPTTIPSE
ncbi:MAG TPA: hypothetical protein VF214_07910 [Edaphobacter sp.]